MVTLENKAVFKNRIAENCWMRKEDTRIQKASKEKRNTRDLGAKCKEVAEKRGIIG